MDPLGVTEHVSNNFYNVISGHQDYNNTICPGDGLYNYLPELRQNVYDYIMELESLEDSDEDGIPDIIDNCRYVLNPDQENWDSDFEGDHCDDTDGDGYLDYEDNCITISNIEQTDWNTNGLGDYCEDTDSDGVYDFEDNCIHVWNPDQTDNDNNLIGNACDDEDSDLDGIIHNDNCPSDVNPNQEDLDGDGIGDVCDPCPTVDNSMVPPGFPCDEEQAINSTNPDCSAEEIQAQKDKLNDLIACVMQPFNAPAFIAPFSPCIGLEEADNVTDFNPYISIWADCVHQKSKYNKGLNYTCKMWRNFPITCHILGLNGFTGCGDVTYEIDDYTPNDCEYNEEFGEAQSWEIDNWNDIRFCCNPNLDATDINMSALIEYYDYQLSCFNGISDATFNCLVLKISIEQLKQMIQNARDDAELNQVMFQNEVEMRNCERFN